MGGRKLSDAALMSEMVTEYGVTATATLMGWALIAGLYGVQNAHDFVAIPFGGLSTRYKRLAEFRAVARHLRSKGYELDGPELLPVALVASRV